MSKTVKILIAGVVVLALLGGGFLLMNKDDDTTTNQSSDSTQTNTTKETSAVNEDTKVEGTLSSISAGGKAQQCTFSYTGANGTGQGSMYGDGKGRGIMTLDMVTEKGNQGKSTTLITSDKAYSWTTVDGNSFGFVFDKAKLTAPAGSSTGTTTGDDANKNFSMQCRDWTVEESKLTPPADINFSSLPG